MKSVIQTSQFKKDIKRLKKTAYVVAAGAASLRRLP